MRLVISRRTFALEDVPSELDLSDLHMFRGANWRGRQRMLLAPAREAPRILAELAERGVRLADEDVRAAAACALADDPVEGAVGVAAFGDPRAIPELSRALDAYTPSTDCVVCDFFAVSSRGQAIEALGGTLTPAQRAKIAEFHERQKGAWIGWPGRDATEASGTRMVPAFIQAAPAAATAPVRRAPRPGRNDPCHCGSGQKYKRCHLDADTRSGGPTETRH